MRTLSLAVLSLGFLGGAAVADDVTVVPAAPQQGVIIHHDGDPDATVVHKEEGCATNTVKKSDDMGNSVTHTETNC